MENRHGLLIDNRLTRVSGHAERLRALDMIAPRADRPQTITLSGDKGFDAADFVMELRGIKVTPHIARNTSRRSAIDVRTTRRPGYAISQRIRKRIEEAFGWMKTVAGLRKTKYRGLDKVGWTFTFAAAACARVQRPLADRRDGPLGQRRHRHGRAELHHIQRRGRLDAFHRRLRLARRSLRQP
jgi:hypothetical protein